MFWQELIKCGYLARNEGAGEWTRPEFYPGVDPAELQAAEEQLNARFPESWRALVQESNGVTDMLRLDSGEWIECNWLVWPVGRVLEENLYFREQAKLEVYDRDFHAVLFFADAGADGILFGFPVRQGFCAASVAVWHPIEDALTEIAPSLEAFIHGWLSGEITV